MSELLVLAGDIGGTKSNLGLYTGSPTAPQPVVERSYLNRKFPDLATVIRHFLVEIGQAPVRACLAVAGAVLDGKASLPNLGWQVSEAGLAQALDLDAVTLLNDLEANALGLDTLTPDQLHNLNPGQARSGANRALIAAGTGLGLALMLPEGDGWQVVASEGGHVDFAPRTEREMALWRFLAADHGHISVERVVSGQGLANVYAYLKHSGLAEPEWLTRRLAEAPDSAAVIAQAGLAGESTLCAEALEMFLSAYGAAAGNLALTALATGGVYLGGGIAPKLLDAFPRSGFLAAFADKGRFAPLLHQIPIHVILEAKCALWGAAAHALGPGVQA